MKILSIGNSFSQNAQRYLYKLAKHNGEEIKTVNLYIGGCALRTHYLNILDNAIAYDLQYNGESTGVRVSIKQVLLSEEWDVVTLQQASHFSGKEETYSPYVEELASYVRKYCPRVKLFLHQTWAYEKDSKRLLEIGGFATPRDMYTAICKANEKAAKAIDADGIIPCGKAMLIASETGIEKVHSDTFHASYGAGQYLLALCWYKKLLGKDIANDTFNEFDVPVSEEERKIVISAVNSAF